MHPAGRTVSTVICAALAAILWIDPARANPAIQNLLDEIRQDHSREQRLLQERERAFLDRRDDARRLLGEAARARAESERRANGLQRELENLETALSDARAGLSRDSADIGQLADISRLVAGELRDRLRPSPTRLQRPDRDGALAALAALDGLPTPTQIQNLWQLLVDDIQLTGSIDQFDHPVTGPDGIERPRSVMRVGSIQLLSDGDYLQFQPASASLLVSPRQPGVATRAQARDFQTGSGSLLAVDPSQGQALRLAGGQRDWRQHLSQGGLIAYVILALAVLAALISLERLLTLIRVRRKLNAQRAGQPAGDNPLARLWMIRDNADDLDTETLGLKLDEAVLRELPRLKRGLSSLSVLGASAPLLGLLGTVAGMIQTFRVVSVFGNADPKLLSAGISQALVTTELGLLAAIPILLLHSYLNSQSNQLVQILDEESAAVLAGFAERRNERLD